MEKNTRITMKQSLSPEQTAKLIELGFEKPNSAISYSYPVQSEEQRAYEASLGLEPYLATVDQIEFEYAYSIGELLSFLPPLINSTKFGTATINIFHDVINWVVGYDDVNGVMRLTTVDLELVDALCTMC